MELTLAGAAPAGAGLLLGLLAGGGRLNAAALLAGLSAASLTAICGWLAAGCCARAGRLPGAAWGLGCAPLFPWVAGWPLVWQAGVDPAARAQLLGARGVVVTYLAAWTVAGMAALALWLHAVPPTAPDALGARRRAPAGGVAPGVPPARLGWLAVPLLALAAVAYWNGAILDPLQYQGFPDYVTQLGGARRLLAGQLPYNPQLRVWADVNLPPVTLLFLFAPFTVFSELGGKLAYFLVNHLAFAAGLAILLHAARPSTLPESACDSTPSRPPAAPARPRSSLLWVSGVVALALTFEPWHDSLRLGQQNGIVFLCLAVSLAALLAGRDALAGVALAAALIGKPSSALLGFYFLAARRRRAVVAGAVAGLLACLMALPWTGWEPWRFYLLEKAPQILAGTPQQSNVALLALHARLFLPPEALSSFDAMPYLPVAQTLTRVAQLLGALALWRIIDMNRGVGRPSLAGRLGRHVEFAIALVLSLSLVGHAWQSYVTWLILALVPLADPRLWAPLSPVVARWVAGLAVAGYAAIALNDVSLYKVIGSASPAATVFASLPNVLLPVLAYVLALLRGAYGGGAGAAGGALAGHGMAGE